MTHFGLICPAATGHLNPMTALGRALMLRGHRVTLVGIPDAAPAAQAVGIAFTPFAEAQFPPGSTASALAELGRLSGTAAFRFTVELFSRATRLILQELPSVLRETGVEAMLVDQTSFGASSVAEVLDLPFVSICCALLLNREPGVPPFNTSWAYHPGWWARLRNQIGYALIEQAAAPVRAEVAAFRERWGLPPQTTANDQYSQLAQISQSSQEFEFPRTQLPRCFHFTGPYSDPNARPSVPFPFERLDGRPLVYASLGTLQNRLLGVFGTIAEACRTLDVQLVIALGGGSAVEDMPPLPGTPLVVRYAPQLELLKHAALTITHAGLNTTLESLGNGVPMVAIPIANDQPGVAARIAWSGTGRVVRLKELSTPRLHAAITQVLGDSTYREQAGRLRASIRQAGGVARAVEIIEQAVRTGKPVLASNLA